MRKVLVVLRIEGNRTFALSAASFAACTRIPPAKWMAHGKSWIRSGDFLASAAFTEAMMDSML
jgi:hypothetical protein